MEVQVLGKRERVAVARRDAGYGIEYATPNSQALPLPFPTNKVGFADELELSAAEVNWIRGHGPVYRIGLLRKQVVFIESLTQPLTQYERYATNASHRRLTWKVLSVFMLLLGLVLYFVGRSLQVRAEASQETTPK